ncbi:MAG: hypothetical protein ACI9SQ_001353, partial [Rubritalea sp.]
AQRHVIFFVSSLPNSTHVFKSTSAKLKKHRKKTHPVTVLHCHINLGG